MEFRLLGPVELWSAGQQHEFGSIKARCVLAVLLLNLGTIVPVDVLIARVWDDHPPAKARESLSAYVTRLRRIVHAVAGDRVTLEGRAHGYLLRADPSLIDIYRYRRLRRDAAILVADGNPARAATRRCTSRDAKATHSMHTASCGRP